MVGGGLGSYIGDVHRHGAMMDDLAVKPGDGGRLGDSGGPRLCKLSGDGGQGILPR